MAWANKTLSVHGDQHNNYHSNVLHQDGASHQALFKTMTLDEEVALEQCRTALNKGGNTYTLYWNISF
jgi:hypothetical protein